MIDHDDVQAALSARLDGEQAALDDDVVDAHVAQCEQCRRFWEESVLLARTLSIPEPPEHGMSPPPDLSQVIMAGVEPEWRKRAQSRAVHLRLARLVVAAFGVVLVVWAGVILAATSGLAPEIGQGVLDPTARPDLALALSDSAAMRLAIAVGLFFAAWRPQMVAGLVPVIATLWTFSLGMAMRDIVLGHLSLHQSVGLAVWLLCAVTLGWLWLAYRGSGFREAWRGLGANPV